jgi:hypothetical protein
VKRVAGSLSVGLALAGPCLADWDAARFRDETTVEIRTVEPEAGEHWSKLWVVVIGGEVYLRLGPRAAGRLERNTQSPYVDARVAGEEFEHVRVEPANDMTSKVAEAMAAKYWTDVLIRHFSHPMTVRLHPEP